MKQNTAPSLTPKFVAEEPEFPSPADTRRKPELEPAPKWKNLTLDELQSWLEEEERRQGLTQ
jgi:hypothetical protein